MSALILLLIGIYLFGPVRHPSPNSDIDFFVTWFACAVFDAIQAVHLIHKETRR